MHEITIPTAVAVTFLELATSGFTEVGDRREVGNNGASIVEASLEGSQSSGGFLFFLELDVDIPYHMISEIVANVETLNLSEFAEFFEDVLVEVLQVLLDLTRVDGLTLGVHAGGDHVGPLVHVRQEQRG